MITGTIKTKVDHIWNAFWSGGISNPMEVIEQLTYLLFIKRLDDIQSLKENKANRTGKPVENPIFSPEQRSLRWSVFKELGDPATMYRVVSDQVFPFIRNLGGEGDNSTYAQHMKDARFTIPTPALLAKVVDMVADIPMEDRDTKGDLYEYMLGKIATAGQNGQFRTPRHIIQLMVDLMEPKPGDTICDPACGSAGFLVAAAEYLQKHQAQTIYASKESTEQFNQDTFFGFDFDSTMLRIGSMNMLLHGVENPQIENRDSLSQSHAGVEDKFSLILANPPFAGSLDKESTAKDLLAVVDTKKTELLFLALFLRIMKNGGRAAVIVPDGVLFGSSKAHKALRKTLVEEHKLDGIISMPSGVFKPYAGVSTAILLFTKTSSGGTDDVWFYDMQADGYSLDDKRNELPDAEGNNDLTDIAMRWKQRNTAEKTRFRTEQSFCVPKQEIADNGYDLSINRYKEVVHEAVEYEAPSKLLADLRKLEEEIMQGMVELEGMLK